MNKPIPIPTLSEERMKSKFVLAWLVFLMMFGAWSLGSDIVDTWRGLRSVWFPLKLALSAVITACAVIYWKRIERDGG